MTIAKSLRLLVAFSAAAATICAVPAFASDDIDEVIVTADLRGRSVEQLPASISVLGDDEIDTLAVQHFEELVSVIPNLNWSGDGHRARYFQIRGVGELEQYQGAPNPSVGFLVDDIDFSGIGTIATLFDVERVEVLRGPQGSRYGANALAGLIYMQSARPSAARNGHLQLGAADDNAWSAGVAFGGTLRRDERAMFRLSAQKHQSDGFRRNGYLERDDTNGRDETVIRGRLLLLPTDAFEINIAALYTDIDNGYDAFALDNTYTVLSDKPGRDAQRSSGASLRMDWDMSDSMSWTSITAYADSAIDFGFDADWGNDDSWGVYTYDYISRSDRLRRTLSQEFRLASTNPASYEWLAGIYALRLEDSLLTINRGQYFDPIFDFSDRLDESLSSTYTADSIAAFAQIEKQFGSATRLAFGLRLERRTAKYSDTAGIAANPTETMVGGELTLSHDLDDSWSAYTSVSKGQKAGGFNLGAVPDGRREFGGEALWNLELGVRGSFRNGDVRTSTAVFMHRRDEQQVRTSEQLIAGDPASFVFFTDNAASGKAYGFETELEWLVDDAWQLYARIGLLDATFDEYSNDQADLGGRRQAHAPGYTFAAGAAWQRGTGWFARIDVSGKGAFYFDVSHNEKSSAYELVNARVGYATERWTARLWARNLFATEYAVRGFYFGNEPPDFPNTLYTRLGDPRQLGVTLDMRF